MISPDRRYLTHFGPIVPRHIFLSRLKRCHQFVIHLGINVIIKFCGSLEPVPTSTRAYTNGALRVNLRAQMVCSTFIQVAFNPDGVLGHLRNLPLSLWLDLTGRRNASFTGGKQQASSERPKAKVSSSQHTVDTQTT